MGRQWHRENTDRVWSCPFSVTFSLRVSFTCLRVLASAGISGHAYHSCCGTAQGLWYREKEKGEKQKNKNQTLEISPTLSLQFKSLENFSWISLITHSTHLWVPGFTEFKQEIVEGENVKFITVAVVFWILVFFPDLPPSIYFAEFSNIPSRFYSLIGGR